MSKFHKVFLIAGFCKASTGMDAVASVRRRRNFTLLSRSVGIGSSELSKLIAIDERVSCFWPKLGDLIIQLAQ